MGKMGLSIYFCFIMLFSMSLANDKTINIIGQGMSVLELKQNILMQNVVNARTPGYKEIKLSQYYDPNKKQFTTKISNIFSIGPMVGSGRDLDFALQDNGFFVVIDAYGDKYLTRDGRFKVNERMELVTMAGEFYVLSEEGNVISLPDANSPRVDNEGTFYDSNDEPLFALKILDLEDYKKLRSVNNVFFYLDEEDEYFLTIPATVRIRQGFYEGSNIDYNKIMVQMADTNVYSSHTQVIQTRLKMMDSAINLLQQN